MPKLLLLPLRLLLLLATPTTLYKTLNATGYVTVVSLLVALLLPHCYLPNANHRKGPFSHVDITKDSNVMFWMDMPALVAPPELPQLEPFN